MTRKSVRWLGYAEGLSLLILLFIAMPAKYVAGMPFLVRHVGMAHGLLFLAYSLTILMMGRELGLTLRQTLWGVILSSIPFGTFWFDRQFLQPRYH